MSLLDQPLDALPWVSDPKLVRLLARLEIVSWRDLLEHYPRRYEDRTQFERFPAGASEKAVCLRGLVQRVSGRFFGGRKVVEATLEEIGVALSGRVICRWFNLFYIQKMLATGQEIIVYGRPKEVRNRIYLDHPEFEILEGDGGEEQIHMGRITPIYPLTEGLKQRPLRTLIFRAVEALKGSGSASTPEEQALIQIHFPDNWENQRQARGLLALGELVAMQVVVEYRKRSVAALAGERHAGAGQLPRKFLGSLPFVPTQAQLRAIEEIRRDLANPTPMNRLLQGDVGSGKTLVSAVAILYAVESGCQGALMAPTQVLAEQHFANFYRWLTPLGVRVALRTSTRQQDSHLELEGAPQVLIGTHALLYDTDQFQQLGLVVIDEQHKFGVLQRAKLLERVPIPDLLVMTATPIPRTLAMTVYGDLEVSTLDEKPADRRSIVTRVRPSAKVPEAAAFIRERIDAGRQAFIIYPVIEESDALSVKAATTEFARWEKMLAPVRCGLLHGKLDAEEKEQVMGSFRKGEIDVLISTTVIEVGVDIPNATVMLIENAERFGLAQLHQLRGRIGRGAHQSYCILLTDRDDPVTLQKLGVLEATEDGFEIAEADLRIRGPGDLLGTAQSGLPPLRLANLVEDGALVVRAKEIAREILDRDPKLRQPRNQRLRRLVRSTLQG
jgi:ATP-dependent DNA helicase RecG